MSDLFKVSDPAGVYDSCADVIDQLLLNELLTVVNGVENFADCERRCGVLANQAKAFLHFPRGGILEPEEMIRFQVFTQPRRFNRREPMVSVMEQVDVGAEFLAKFFKELGSEIQIALC